MWRSWSATCVTPLRERDELVAEVDEGHARAAPAQLHVVEDPPEERDRLVDVADLDREVVDADESRHERRVTATSGVRPLKGSDPG